MPFPYIGTNGLFTRVGALGGFFNSINSFVGTANLSAANIESVGPAIDKVAGEYASPDLNLIGGLYSARDSYRSVHSSMLSYLQTLAQATLVQMVNDYSPLPKQDLPTALAWLVNQMKTDAQTVAKPTVSAASAAGGSNVGSGAVVASVLGPNGAQLDYPLAETITLTCTSDGQSGATAGQEAFSITSPLAESNPLLWDWPLGTQISLTQNAVDALADNSGGNLLQNGSFKQWTNPAIGPDNWLILDAGGGVGTSIIQVNGSNVYKGSAGIAFVGDGTHTPSISQPFGATTSTAGNAGGTSASLSPLTQYALNLFLKVSVVPAAGTLLVELTDGNNNVVNDANGVANSLSINLTAATTGFVAHNITFRTPAVIPSSGFRLRIRLSGTALSNGTTLYFGHTALAPVPYLYQGGPALVLFSGTPNFIKGDTFTLTVSNNYASAWQKLADRFFGMRALGLQLPSGASPTVLDSLIA